MSTPYVILGSEPIPGTDLSHVRVAFGTHSQAVVTVLTEVVGTPDADAVITLIMEIRDRVEDMTQGEEH